MINSKIRLLYFLAFFNIKELKEITRETAKLWVKYQHKYNTYNARLLANYIVDELK